MFSPFSFFRNWASFSFGNRACQDYGKSPRARQNKVGVGRVAIFGVGQEPSSECSCMICQVPGASYGTVVGADGRTSSCANFSTSPACISILTAHDMIIANVLLCWTPVGE
jgi:hypothetical protein